MNKKFMSLASLFKSQKEDADESDSKEAAKKKSPSKDEDSDDDDDSDDEKEDKAKKDEKKKSAETEKPISEESDDSKSARIDNSVHLALDDFTQLMALASTAKSATAENKKLKAKADEWDNYQAALSGTKPGADTAGAKAEEQTQDSKDPHAGLRAKFGSLMEDC